MKFLKKILNFFRRSRQQDRDREKGAITVAETLIALSVGATVLAFVFAGIPALIDARNSSQAHGGLAQLSTAVRLAFGPRGDFSGLNTDLATDLAGFPPHFRAGSNAVHPWGGAVSIDAAPGNSRLFQVEFADVPSRGCTTIAAATVSLATRIQIGNHVVDLSAVDDPSTTVDESAPANITALCSTASEVDVTWTFSA